MQIQTNVQRSQLSRPQTSRENKAESNHSQTLKSHSSTIRSGSLDDVGENASFHFKQLLSQQHSGNQNGPDTLLQNQFSNLAQDKTAFHNTMQQVYGDNYNSAEAETMREQALDGNFDWLPEVRYVDADVLAGANGAYDTESETVLINANLKGTELGAQTCSR